VELLRTLLSRTLGLGGDKPEPVLDELSLQGVSRFLKSDRCKNVVCMVGAGISTSAGIPDFRSPGTGLYSNLQSYDLPYPEAIFEIGFFKKHPEPFFALARELYPGQFKPTVCHYFMRLLQDKGLLLRCYTQNIDTLERVAGLDPELLVEAHGTFFTSHCLRPSCRQCYGLAWMRERIFSSLVPKCEKCQGLVKPGELRGEVSVGITPPTRGEVSVGLTPSPSHSPPSLPPPQTLCFLGRTSPHASSPSWSRDVAWLGDCDSGCLALAELLGWKEELEELVRREHAAIDAKGEDRDGGDQKRRGDKDKDGGNSKKSLGDNGKAQRDPKKSL
ncbi:SIR2 deacetylase, partial [Pteruthius melanotis]|nr:SIR2 deacetylase [Pteruthius melanotis]